VERALRAVGALPPKLAARLHGQSQVAVVRTHQRVADAVHAGVRPVARRQLHALRERAAPAAADDLRAEVHHEPHPEARGARRVVRARDVVHQPRERDVVLGAVAASDLVHQRVAVAFERRSGRASPRVDARQLVGGIAGAVDVLQEEAHVARPLRVRTADLLALPQPRAGSIRARAAGEECKDNERRGDDQASHV
jgi:hypothetical protein